MVGWSSPKRLQNAESLLSPCCWALPRPKRFRNFSFCDDDDGSLPGNPGQGLQGREGAAPHSSARPDDTGGAWRASEERCTAVVVAAGCSRSASTWRLFFPW